ncbi:MAG: dephospho-CoA kinase [Bacillota bacterium]|jgi:dephospho-CoA kinase
MLRIGLTGGIASGKSTVSAMLQELGAFVVDSDQLAREVVLPGQPAYRQIVHEFGSDILQPDGEIDRRRLGQLIFADAERRRRLNEITHPAVIRRIEEIVNTLEESGHQQPVILDIPLLIEANLQHLVDQVWLVTVRPDTQLKRLMERNGYGESEAQRRIAAQMPLEEKAQYADRIIDNEDSLAETRAQVERLWAEVTRKCKG